MDDYVSKSQHADALETVLARWMGVEAPNGGTPTAPLDREALDACRTELAGLGPGKSVDPFIGRCVEMMPGRATRSSRRPTRPATRSRRAWKLPPR